LNKHEKGLIDRRGYRMMYLKRQRKRSGKSVGSNAKRMEDRGKRRPEYR